jgi:hypothetical protein
MPAKALAALADVLATAGDVGGDTRPVRPTNGAAAGD